MARSTSAAFWLDPTRSSQYIQRRSVDVGALGNGRADHWEGCLMSQFVSDEQIQLFHDQGFIVIKGFISANAAGRFKQHALSDPAIAQNAYERADADGRKSKVTLWYDPGDDIFGRLSRSDKMTDITGACLGGEACFFHAKLMQKEPRSGGAWEWHQDYGYWYDDGFLSADMASCYVAFDAATRENGCLMVMPCTHHYGRLRHGGAGEQVGACMARVDALQQRHAPVYVELEPGDAVIFHANLLHASKANLSDQSRWGMITSFFRADNESIADDARFRRKPHAAVPHDKILDGATRSELSKNYLSVN